MKRSNRVCTRPASLGPLFNGPTRLAWLDRRSAAEQSVTGLSLWVKRRRWPCFEPCCEGEDRSSRRGRTCTARRWNHHVVWSRSLDGRARTAGRVEHGSTHNRRPVKDAAGTERRGPRSCFSTWATRSFAPILRGPASIARACSSRASTSPRRTSSARCCRRRRPAAGGTSMRPVRADRREILAAVLAFDAAVLSAPGHAESRDTFRKIEDAFARRSAWYVYPDVMPALDALRANGIRLCVISNFVWGAPGADPRPGAGCPFREARRQRPGRLPEAQSGHLQGRPRADERRAGARDGTSATRIARTSSVRGGVGINGVLIDRVAGTIRRASASSTRTGLVTSSRTCSSCSTCSRSSARLSRLPEPWRLFVAAPLPEDACSGRVGRPGAAARRHFRRTRWMRPDVVSSDARIHGRRRCARASTIAARPRLRSRAARRVSRRALSGAGGHIDDRPGRRPAAWRG